MLVPLKLEYIDENGKKTASVMMVTDLEYKEAKTLSLPELKAYIADIEAKLEEVLNLKPAEDSKEYEAWDIEFAQLQDMIEEAEGRLFELRDKGVCIL